MASVDTFAEVLIVLHCPVPLQPLLKRAFDNFLSLSRGSDRVPSCEREQEQDSDDPVRTISKSATPRRLTVYSIRPEMDTTPRRSTVPTIVPRQSAQTPRFGQAQCTHLTVTRLYTSEFRCSVCFREGPAGWLWRCTQDRELLLEEDSRYGFEVSTEEGSTHP